jgi:hypothetical protein
MILPLLLIACSNDKSVTEDGVVDTGDGVIETPDADADGYDAEEDCDDANSVVNPGAAEICDGIDNNCDGIVDEGVTTTFYADADGDGFGDEGTTIEACEQPDGYVPIGNDCDDSDAEIYPSAPERCDGVDNDCDGEIDEDLLETWYADPDAGIESCDPGEGYVEDDDDCDDSDASAYPGGEEVCDGVDNDCDGSTDEGVGDTFYADADGDGFGDEDATTEACEVPSGYTADATDCDDADAAVNPDAEEVCNEIDDDCDGSIDEDDAADAGTWYADADGDGYGDADSSTAACEQPSGYVADSTDCDDDEAAANPGTAEVCDEIDNDCDGDTDEGVQDTFYADDDGDGFGDADDTTEACEAPSGYTADATDCDDADAAVNPDAAEVCNEIDDDCDGDIDEGVTDTFYADADGDGFGDADDTTEACEVPSGYTADATDCDDDDAAINPDAEEVCNEVDDDCDGDIDEDAANPGTWYADDDGDGYGDPDLSTTACEAPSGYVDNDGDCDDGNNTISPDGTEVCNGEDDDCDGTVDQDAADPDTFYADADGDGFGDADSTTTDCEAPSGYTADATDCDDADAAINPDAIDRCDGEDNDCDGDIDEAATENAWLASFYSGVFYELHPDSGSYTELTAPDDSSLSSYASNGLASSLDGSGGIAYVHDSSNNRLLELNVCDEELTELGDTNVGNTCGIAFGPDGELYGIDTENDTLVVFDLSDGSATEIGDLGFNLQNCALTYDCAADTLVGMQVDTSDNTGLLFSIDVSTGAATEEVTLDSSVTWTSAGLQYDPPSGLYFASTGEGIFEVDISDGSATEVIDLATNNLSYIVDECN